MKKGFSVAIATPGSHLLTFEAKGLKLPGDRGYIGIMAGRQDMLAAMDPGLIWIVDMDNNDHLFATTGGFCEMLENKVTLLCDTLITEKQLDLSLPVADETIFQRDPTTLTEKEKRAYVTDLFKRKIFKDRPAATVKQ